MLIMRGGRARWRIENETFSTLKNQGYEFEHNFGHGNQNLSTNFGLLMMIAFLVDQLQELCCMRKSEYRGHSNRTYRGQAVGRMADTLSEHRGQVNQFDLIFAA